MTPSEISTSARQSYNAVGDSFFQDENIYFWIYQAQMILAQDANVIEDSTTQNTVASTQAYDYPTNAIAIKRVTYAGRKLKPITFRQLDSVTLSNAASSQTGTPAYYVDWEGQLILFPVPDAAAELKMYFQAMPGTVSAASTLEVPKVHHMSIVDYVLEQMFAQDQNLPMATFYGNRWKEHVNRAKSTAKRKKRADGYATVQTEESLPSGVLGEI